MVYGRTPFGHIPNLANISLPRFKNQVAPSIDLHKLILQISFRSDVWSLGCILYSMVYGRTPFGHIPNLAITYSAVNALKIPIHPQISFRSDVWSLGCILYSMVYGRTPFGHIPNLAKLAAILDPNHRIEYPPVEHLPPSLISALKWCLTYNARARPTVRELLAIPYMQPQPQPHPKPPLPQQLIEKLQATLTQQEFRLLMQRLQ
ncbi:protein kinase domain-containing protein [Phthorimaea operculella]|nr:protein kinase domain-containing protein [Phthorimaea operculella]